MTNRFAFSLFAFTFAILATGGCADAPTSVGARILPAGDRPLLRQDTLYAVSHSQMQAIFNTSYGGYVLVGDTANFSAWTFLQFTALPDSFYFSTISQATITMTCRYRFGSPSAPLSFDVYRAVRSWQGDSLNVDSLIQRPGDYYDPTPLTTVSVPAIADTGTIQFSIPDTALVRSWFNAYPDSLQQTYGLVLRPTNANVVRGFGSFSNTITALRPKLDIQYSLPTSSGPYTVQYGLSKFVASVPPADVLKDTSSYVYMQNGVGIRGQLLFDISRLPRSTVVNRAYLEVFLAAPQSLRTGLAPDSLSFYMATDGSLILSLARTSVALRDSAGRQYYQMDVRDYLQNWLGAPTTPRRIGLTGAAETEALDLLVINSSDSTRTPRALRPRIRLIYSSLQH
jgi:hypothetical protein